MSASSFDLDTTLIMFAQSDPPWTIREAVEGVQIFGGIGSGKTSGSGKTLALKYLSNGFGGLVLTAKPDEKMMWQDYCKQTSRLNDLIIVEPNGEHFFNFLGYETSKKLDGISITENIVQVLKTVIRSSEEKSGGKSDDPFWETALDMLIFNVIDLCQLAYGSCSVDQLYNVVLSAPKKGIVKNPSIQSNAFADAFNAAQKKLISKIADLENLLSEEEKEAWKDPVIKTQQIEDRIPEATLLKFIDQFFCETYMNLGEKTRSIVEFSFLGFLFRLLKEPVYSLFCRHRSTFQPEDCLDGKIILLNLPVKKYHKVGRDSQVMFKYIWQRAMEARDVNRNNRPVFLWADESQNFLHEYDAEYQATARSSRIATVYISQNLPNYNASMGGVHSNDRVKSFLGTLGTKIFHSNADVETNKYASDLIGEGYSKDSQKTKVIMGESHVTESTSYKLEKMARPEEFTLLRNGSSHNDFFVDSYFHRQARQFSNGQNFKRITFKQL